MADWTEEYRAKVRDFMADNGEKVDIQPKRHDWEGDDEVSTYGWTDYDATWHILGRDGTPGCRWVVPEGTTLYERTYSQFQDTDSDNLHEVGVNVRGCECACGKYQKVTLRWTGSVTEMLHSILGIPQQIEVTL